MATRGSSNGRTISCSAFGARVESESTKQSTSASEARMPAAIAARLPRLHEKRSACRDGWRRAALQISRQVPSVEPSSTTYTLSSSDG